MREQLSLHSKEKGSNAKERGHWHCEDSHSFLMHCPEDS